jgi:hypothetical protein
MEIVKKEYHANGSAQPYVAYIIDTPEDGQTKLVIMFEDTDCVAVLSLDALIGDEDISVEGNGYDGGKYEKLRAYLWNDLTL